METVQEIIYGTTIIAAGIAIVMMMIAGIVRMKKGVK